MGKQSQEKGKAKEGRKTAKLKSTSDHSQGRKEMNDIDNIPQES